MPLCAQQINFKLPYDTMYLSFHAPSLADSTLLCSLQPTGDEQRAARKLFNLVCLPCLLYFMPPSRQTRSCTYRARSLLQFAVV